MSMLYCAVPGCESTTKTTKYTFHRFPRDVIRRARWILAVRCPVRSLNGRSRVCGRHFHKSMFTRPARGVELVKHAVPTLYLPPKTRPATEPAKEEYTYTYDTPFERESSVEQESNETDEIHSVVTNRIKKSVKTDLSGDVAACRGCLETKGQLRDIRDIGLEDIFLELSGEECLQIGLPRHLCVFCASQLSRCAAFRARCRQSSALLQTLVDFSTKPLTINDIKTIDRQKHKLTHGFTPKIVCHFQTDPYVNMLCDETREDEIHALAPDQSDTESKITQDYTEIEYLESDDDENIETHSNVHLVIKKEIKYENFYSDRDEDQFENDVSDTNASDEPTEPVVTRNKVERVEDETDYESGMESDTSEEIKELRKAVKLKKSLQLQPTTLNKKMATYTKSESIMISALEKKYNCVVRLFTLEEQKREIEERKRYNRAPYCCDYCGKGFHSEIFMIKHLSNHDQSLPHVCDLCGCGFRNRDTYRSHVYSHRESYTCRDCGSVCRDRNSAIKHAESHQGNPHTCPHCGKVIQTTKAFYVHVRMLHPEHSELCNACGKTFFSTRSLRQHITIFHQGINKLEIENNDENVPYQRHCDSCNKTFLTAASFEQHELSEHGKDRKRIIRPIHRPSDLPGFSLVCELCGKAFKSPKQLRTHMKLHRAKKKHQCPHCPKAFRENSLLRNHLRVHTGERPFQCEQCPRTFALRTNLVRHVHIVHLGLEPRTLCPECGKDMCVRSLPLHIRSVHRNIKYIRKRPDRRVGRKRVKKPKTVNDELTINEAIAALMKSEKLTKR